MVLSEEPRKYKMIHFLKRSLLKQSLASLQYYFSGQYLIVATHYGPVTEKKRYKTVFIIQQLPLTTSQPFYIGKWLGPADKEWLIAPLPTGCCARKESWRGVLEAQERCSEPQLLNKYFPARILRRDPRSPPYSSSLTCSPNYAFAVLLNCSQLGEKSKYYTE